MLFNSAVFVLGFLPVVLGVLFLIGHRQLHQLAVVWLVLASSFFYAWFSVRYLAMFAVLIFMNYILGNALARDFNRHRQNAYLLAFGIVLNLSVLVYFKYASFFIDNINQASGTSFTLINVIIPVGISFFTFQKIAYLVDAYRGEAASYSLIEFSFFVLFFPQLIAGPIVHHKDIIPQLRRSDFRFHPTSMAAGILLFIIGLFKKVAVADSVAEWSNAFFSAAKTNAAIGLLDAWFGVLSFTFQIYFDFSGYTDMALGLALMVGLRLPVNFSSPYKSTNIIMFWRTWHVSLSNFLRDYVYIPLGGNRRGRSVRYFNLIVTMLIGGLWHGAAWTFLAWGLLHGIYLVIVHGWIKLRRVNGLNGTFGLMGKWAATVITFVAVSIAWVFFRAEDFSTAAAILKAMAFADGWGSADNRWVTIAGLVLFVWLLPNSQELLARRHPILANPAAAVLPTFLRAPSSLLGFTTTNGALALEKTTGVIAALALVGLLTYQSMKSTDLQPFIYFQF